MNIINNKKIICITGTVWTFNKDAPRFKLQLAGFTRPKWFSTGRPVSDANFYPISETDYHQAISSNKVLAHMEYGGLHVGIMKSDFDDALKTSHSGVLIVGFPEIISQIASTYPSTRVFAYKQQGSDLSRYLGESVKHHQLTRLDIDAMKQSDWKRATETIKEIVNL